MVTTADNRAVVLLEPFSGLPRMVEIHTSPALSFIRSWEWGSSPRLPTIQAWETQRAPWNHAGFMSLLPKNNYLTAIRASFPDADSGNSSSAITAFAKRQPNAIVTETDDSGRVVWSLEFAPPKMDDRGAVKTEREAEGGAGLHCSRFVYTVPRAFRFLDRPMLQLVAPKEKFVWGTNATIRMEVWNNHLEHRAVSGWISVHWRQHTLLTERFLFPPASWQGMSLSAEFSTAVFPVASQSFTCTVVLRNNEGFRTDQRFVLKLKQS
eukprot:NODE_3584_length_950_cov_22.485017_g3293_i0.p1 GENE.NODE_3584_length_950_cov_22.485017_g3293_i0~~NODE_3584_length_950_cov_22.485017_g3293_i0.p1  ORF type:complete len:288 (-),score=33.17 NODE_3584_length_950_cov_22.485017_g3293_i0:87-884(-)